MNKSISLLIVIMVNSLCVMSQNGGTINLDLDYSIGPHYYRSNIENPVALTFNVSYEFRMNKYLGIESGMKAGGFYQDVEHGEEEFKKYTNVYKGAIFAPFISPKLYVTLREYSNFNRDGYLFFGTKFMYSIYKVNTKGLSNFSGSERSKRMNFEIKAGYEYPIHNSWNMRLWLGYNSFDFSKLTVQDMKFKSSTPLQIGIGFSLQLF